MLTKGIHCTGSAVLTATAFWDEEAVVGQRILVSPAFEPRIVDVGSQTEQLRSATMPKVDEMCQRPCRRILPRLAATTVHRCIYIEWHLGVFSGGLAESAYILGIVVGHENLVGIDVVAEDLLPSLAIGIETRFQPGMQRLLVLFQIADKFLRHTFLICLFCQRRVVAGILQHTNFVFHLNHCHHVASCPADMFHQCLKCLIVSLKNLLREAACYLQRLAVAGTCSWETLHVLFKPQRCIARHRVLPCAKPQEYHFQL